MSERLTVGEAARLLTGSLSAEAMRSPAGVFAMESVRTAADGLLSLASASQAEELNTVLTDAASMGDVATFAALDTVLTPWQRKRVLALALVDENRDRKLHSRLRAALDPALAAEMAALIELAEFLMGNARGARDMAGIVSTSANAEGLAPIVDEATAPLAEILATLKA